MSNDRSPKPRWYQGWAVSNHGILQAVERTRRDAIDYVEQQTGEPWRKAKRYMEVWKCRVVPR